MTTEQKVFARHVHVRSAEVDLTTHPGRHLDVRDNGIGIDPTTRSSGLANMRRRAERHGGTLTLTHRSGLIAAGTGPSTLPIAHSFPNLEV